MECWDGGMDVVFPVISFLTERIIQEIYNKQSICLCELSGSFGSSLGRKQDDGPPQDGAVILFSNNYRNGDISTSSLSSLNSPCMNVSQLSIPSITKHTSSPMIL